MMFCILGLALASVAAVFLESVLRGQIRREAPGFERDVFNEPLPGKPPIFLVKSRGLLSETAFAALGGNIQQTARWLRLSVLMQLLFVAGGMLSLLLV
jgi:heme/copper-type cytochrome/quinol oxidase subunit 3